MLKPNFSLLGSLDDLPALATVLAPVAISYGGYSGCGGEGQGRFKSPGPSTLCVKIVWISWN